MSLPEYHSGIVNCLGAPWPEDLSPAFIDQLREQGVAVVGCTANLTWDDTIESIENFETVKATVRGHPHAYVLRSAADLDRPEHRGKIGVLFGLQNPKASATACVCSTLSSILAYAVCRWPSAKTATTAAAMPARTIQG